MTTDKSKMYQSILVIVVGFAILSLILKIKLFLTIGILIGVLALASSTMAGWINWVWFKIAEVLGWINSKILITLVYYVFLFPISAIYKLGHKDVLKRKKQSQSPTYYSEREHQYLPKDFENIW